MDPLWARLLNSDWHDHRGSGRREDRIGNEAWLAGFLADAGWSGSGLPDAAGRERLRALRTTLRRGVDALLAGRALPREVAAEVNRALAVAPLVRRLRGGGRAWSVEETVVGEPVERVLASVAGSFAAMLADGDPTRIKICANSDCLWVIYDSSRNRTRRWCDAKECGNLIKVRRFRSRRRVAEQTATR
jgi:predicted RNA-binding Zn ribbon-like protein